MPSEAVLQPGVHSSTLASVLALAGARWNDRPFLSWDGETVTYAALCRDADRVAGALLAAGVAKGDAVAIMLDNRPEYLAAWFGASRIGAIEVSVNNAFKGEILRYVLAHSDARVLICQIDYLEQVLAHSNDLTQLRHVVVVGGEPRARRSGHIDLTVWSDFRDLAGDSVPDCAVAPTDVAQISYTSGTTGRSKGVLISHNRIVQTGADMVDLRGIDTSDVLYTCLPLFHGNAKYLTVVPALLAGAQVALGKRFSASGFWDEVRAYEATQFNYLGVMIAILGKQRPGPRDRDHQLRLGWGAGAPHDQIDTFEARFGVTLVEGYGLTEAGIPLSNLPSERRVGSCGKALPGYEVQLVDEDDEPVPVGAVGEIVIRPQRANTTMLGYHKMPEETLERFRNLWLHTGDLARMDVDGFFYFVDRAKDAIRRRGENISSQEIEVVLNAHPDVLESAAVPVPSELTDEDVLAVVHPRPGSNPTPEALFAYCEENMPYFWVPRYLRIVDEPLPRTQTNKIEKHKLRAVGPGADAFERKGSSPQPRTEEETGGA